MRTYYLDTIGKRIADFLYSKGYEGEVEFDASSFAEEMPTLIIGGITKFDIYRFYINPYGNEVTITTIKDGKWWDYTFYLDFRKDDDDYERFYMENRKDYDNHIKSWGIYQLFCNVLASTIEYAEEDKKVMRLYDRCFES